MVPGVVLRQNKIKKKNISISNDLSFWSPAIDLLYGGIYCFACQDYIYDKDMEQIAKEEQRKAWKLQGGH